MIRAWLTSIAIKILIEAIMIMIKSDTTDYWITRFFKETNASVYYYDIDNFNFNFDNVSEEKLRVFLYDFFKSNS